jgi:predicted nucleic acid-binding protein
LKTYIVDASVATRFILTEDYGENAQKLLGDFIKGEVELTAPRIINYEVGNALRTATAKNIIEATEAQNAFRRFLALKLGGKNIADDELLGALEWSTKKGVSLYDGVYIWFSIKLGYPLLTADSKQLKAAKGEADTIHLRDYAR